MPSDIVFSIEGLGAGTTTRQLYFARGTSPSWDSDNAWVESCWSQMPGEIETSISFLDGSSTIGGLTLEVFAEAKAQQGQTIASMLYNQTRVSVGTLQSDITDTSTTIQLDSSATGLANTHISLGREVILLGTHAGSGQYTGCGRGRWGTRSEDHSAADFSEVFLAIKGPVLRYRKVTLFRVDLDAATFYSDLEELGSFVIYAITAPSPEVIRIECDSLISIFEKRTILNQLYRTGISYVTTTVVTSQQGEPPPEPSFGAAQRDLRAAQADATFSVDGEAVIKPTINTQASQFNVQGFDDSDIVRTLDSPPRAQKLPAKMQEVWECFVCNGDDSDIDALPLSSNLLTLFLQILTTSKDGTNGSYDLGIEDLGLNIQRSMVDVAGIEETRDKLGGLLNQDLLVLGLDGEPLEVFSFFKEHLLPYGLVICDRGGKVSIASLADNDPDAPTLTESADILGPASTPPRSAPVQSRRMDLSMDAISVSFKSVPGFDPVVDTLVDGERRRLTVYGSDTPRELKMSFIKDRAGVLGALLPLLQRLHDDIPQIVITVLRTREADLQLGDLVSVTHSKIYSPLDGVRGVTGELCLVTSRVLSLAENTLTVTLLDVGAIYAKTAVIAPSAVVESGASGVTIPLAEDFADGGFQSGRLSAAPKDVSSFSVGDNLQHCNDHGVFVQNVKIVAIATSPSSITVKTTPSPLPAAGDILRLQPYDGNLSAAKDRFAFIADTGGTLGSSSDAGKEYTSR